MTVLEKNAQFEDEVLTSNHLELDNLSLLTHLTMEAIIVAALADAYPEEDREYVVPIDYNQLYVERENNTFIIKTYKSIESPEDNEDYDYDDENFFRFILENGYAKLTTPANGLEDYMFLLPVYVSRLLQEMTIVGNMANEYKILNNYAEFEEEAKEAIENDTIKDVDYESPKDEENFVQGIEDRGTMEDMEKEEIERMENVATGEEYSEDYDASEDDEWRKV